MQFSIYCLFRAIACEQKRFCATARRQHPSFEKFLNIGDRVRPQLNFALAELGLAQAIALVGDVAEARKAYQDFLILWKDADPDIPILISAKADYAKLQ